VAHPLGFDFTKGAVFDFVSSLLDTYAGRTTRRSYAGAGSALRHGFSPFAPEMLHSYHFPVPIPADTPSTLSLEGLSRSKQAT
jgi:hypothetical protein